MALNFELVVSNQLFSVVLVANLQVIQNLAPSTIVWLRVASMWHSNYGPKRLLINAWSLNLINIWQMFMLEQTILLWNHTSHTKVYFNELVANVLHDNMDNHFWLLRLWRLIEAKNIISRCTLWHFNSTFGSSLNASSAYQRFTYQEMRSVMSFSLHIANSRTKPAISSTYINFK